MYYPRKQYTDVWVVIIIAAMIILLGGCVSAQKEANKVDLARIYAEIGLGHLRNGRSDLAKERLHKSIENNPNYAPAHHYLAQVYFQLGNREQARQYYESALKLDSSNPFLQNNYAVFLCDTGKIDDAEMWFLKLADNINYSMPHSLYENLGNCVYRGQSPAQKMRAETYFKRALSYEPTLIISLSKMAEINLNKGEHFKARAYLERFMALETYTPEMLLLGVKVEKQLGDNEMMAYYKTLLMERFGRTIQAEQASRIE
ncbi:hypothetical protein MNBD_GAMMA16-687 [hydrothermal vent metagenome]|uniref:Uncharacterized protein n=1 Tax=hydrothermal vent metagenome TaxID=652676 RepID=A0A3B0Z4T8_9ZZZZ